jgi:hypothetical protein
MKQMFGLIVVVLLTCSACMPKTEKNSGASPAPTATNTTIQILSPNPTTTTSSIKTPQPSSKTSAKPTTKPSPTPNKTATPTTATTSTNNSTNTSTPTATPQKTATPTTYIPVVTAQPITPTPSPTPTPSTSYTGTISIDKTHIDSTIHRSNGVQPNGMMLGDSLVITSNGAKAFNMKKIEATLGSGFQTSGGGINQGSSIVNKIYVTDSWPNGTYTGKFNVQYYKDTLDSSGSIVYVDGPEVTYTITLTD